MNTQEMVSWLKRLRYWSGTDNEIMKEVAACLEEQELTIMQLQSERDQLQSTVDRYARGELTVERRIPAKAIVGGRRDEQPPWTREPPTREGEWWYWVRGMKKPIKHTLVRGSRNRLMTDTTPAVIVESLDGRAWWLPVETPQAPTEDKT